MKGKRDEATTEAKIERRACDWAKSKGWYVRKFVSPGMRGVPDRIFIKDGRVVFIEFKSAKGKTTPLQEYEIKQLRDQGMEVYVASSVEQAKEMLLGIVRIDKEHELDWLDE